MVGAVYLTFIHIYTHAYPYVCVDMNKCLTIQVPTTPSRNNHVSSVRSSYWPMGIYTYLYLYIYTYNHLLT